MLCQGKYFSLVEGKLVCSQCGRAADEHKEAPAENKALPVAAPAHRGRGRPRRG